MSHGPAEIIEDRRKKERQENVSDIVYLSARARLFRGMSQDLIRRSSNNGRYSREGRVCEIMGASWQCGGTCIRISTGQERQFLYGSPVILRIMSLPRPRAWSVIVSYLWRSLGYLYGIFVDVPAGSARLGQHVSYVFVLARTYVSVFVEATLGIDQ